MKPVTAHEVGQRLRQIRWRLKLSQHDIGEIIGVSYQQVQSYETGRNRLSCCRAATLCRALDVRISDLIPADDEERPTLSAGAFELGEIYDTLPSEDRRILTRLALMAKSQSQTTR